MKFSASWPVRKSIKNRTIEEGGKLKWHFGSLFFAHFKSCRNSYIMDWPSNKENLYQNVVKAFVLDKVDQYVRFYSESAEKRLNFGFTQQLQSHRKKFNAGLNLCQDHIFPWNKRFILRTQCPLTVAYAFVFTRCKRSFYLLADLLTPPQKRI